MGRNSSFDITVAINPGNSINRGVRDLAGFKASPKMLKSSLTMAAAALRTHHESGTVSLPRNFYVQDLSMLLDERV